MNPFTSDIAEFLARETPLSPEAAGALIEIPPDPAVGDYAVPCFKLAKAMRRPPQEIAKVLGAAFVPTDRVVAVEVAGPYLNFRLHRVRFFEETLEDPATGSPEGEGKTIVLDFCSPNISKPLAYHHLRSTCIGFSLKRIFTHLGYRAVGINHLGDWGTTHGMVLAAFKRWGGDLDLDRLTIADLTRLYVRFHREGDEEEGRKWFQKLEAGDPEARSLWERFRRISLAEHQQVYDLLGVTFDEIRGESDYLRDLEAVIEKVRASGLATISDGALVVDLSDEDMPPLFLRKADRATVYATRDLAAALHRWETYRFSRCLYVVAMEQALHFRQLFTVLRRLGLPFADRMEHVGFGLVRFGGRKTGTRKGGTVLLREVLEEAVERIRGIIEEKNPDLPEKDEVARAVGVGAVIFADLCARRVKDVDFTWEEMLNFDGHTGPYIQYTHARCASILRRAGGVAEGTAAYHLLTLPEEWDVARLLARFGDRVAAAARDAEPSLVAQYLLTLSETFSRYYNLGNQDPARKVLTADREVSTARLRLVAGVRDVLARGLWLLGIRAPEEM